MKQLRFYLVYLVLIVAALFVFFHEDVSEPVAQPLADIPLRSAGWVKINESHFSEAVLEKLRPTEYLYRVYVMSDGNAPSDGARDGLGSGRRVTLYLGYHGGGPNSGPIHSPKHCLPGSGWHNLSENIKNIAIGNATIAIVESVYQKGDQRELFLYWFQVQGETLTNEYALKFAEITNSILHNRRDSAFIRISIPYRDGDKNALVMGEQFVRDFYPHIQAVLPR